MLCEKWEFCERSPAADSDPACLDAAAPDWMPATVPGTVAQALQVNGRWNDRQPLDLDGRDWWYRATFVRPEVPADQPCMLRFEGLATQVEAWLNGQPLLAADNMFRAHAVDVTSRLQPVNELVMVFRSLTEALKRKRPRPRWKTNLVAHQQLRWMRTSLLGRIPGWTPPQPIIGPWRDVRLDASPLILTHTRCSARVDGTLGRVVFEATGRAASRVTRAWLRVGAGTDQALTPLEIDEEAAGVRIRGEAVVEHPRLWWPHTHGDQPRYPCELVLEQDGSQRSIDCGAVGFRRLEVAAEPGFSIRLNGEPVYCRGACWTVTDLTDPHGREEELRHDLALAVAAGVNMLRVGGTMAYESDLFYRLCDELGILVWQDFMFANMDYPVDDPHFAANIDAEASGQLARLASHPCVAVYCGNSEVEQQAAMVGVPRELWRNAWFAERLPRLCAELHPGTAYVPSTPSGGALPFHVSSGVAHFYGVGAYLRSPAELRKANVGFTTECLGFANLPEPETLYRITDGAAPVAHHPRWKQRVPRDTGTGWDFEDVRDYYLRYLYDIDPVALRSFDTPRYLALSRTVSGEMMAQTFAEWRSTQSGNQGGLVWFFKDLWPATGWGIVDSSGLPKPAYYYLRRSWLSRQITLTDEGLDGVQAHVINETTAPLRGFVEFLLLKEPAVAIARQEVAIDIAPRSQKRLCADEAFGLFYDVSYAYRFGPPHHDIVAVTLLDEEHRVLSEAFHFVRRREPTMCSGVPLEAAALAAESGEYLVTLRSPCFLHSVRLAASGFLPDDNYFHLTPGRTKSIAFRRRRPGQGGFRASIEALNLEAAEFVACSSSREVGDRQ